jgi:hypothetical protein
MGNEIQLKKAKSLEPDESSKYLQGLEPRRGIPKSLVPETGGEIR